jgi:secreted trypsin-like serine protease
MKLFSILLLLTFLQSNVCHESQARIFGGSEAPIDAFPWMVSIRLDALNQLVHLCGGAIVSDSFVLTAASCVQQAVVFNSLFSINAGIHSVTNGNETTGQLRRISQAILHPNYNSQNNLNNIALVRVSPAFNMKTLSVAAISLSNLTSLENMNLTTVGWGLMTNRTNSTEPTIFLQQIIIQENVRCSQNVVIDPDTQLCATGEKYFYCLRFLLIFISSR